MKIGIPAEGSRGANPTMNGRRKQSGGPGGRQGRGQRQEGGNEPDRVSLLRLGAALAAGERDLESCWRLPDGEDLIAFAFRSGFAAASMLPEACLVASPESDRRPRKQRPDKAAARLNRARPRPK